MQDVTTWFRVTLWNRQAETASKYLTKGSPVYVEGRLRVEEWNDKDGKSRYTLEVNGTDMQFISSGRGDEYTGESSTNTRTDFEGSNTGANQNQSAPSDDDIPF